MSVGTSNARNTSGCAHDSHKPAGTRPSPSSDRPMFENGSGEVLTAARVLALAAWLVAASVPPSSAAATDQLPWSAPNTDAASAAPAGMRTSVCSKSHSVSMPGILSAKNSITSIRPLAPSSSGLCSNCSPRGRSTQPIAPASPVKKSTA